MSPGGETQSGSKDECLRIAHLDADNPDPVDVTPINAPIGRERVANMVRGEYELISVHQG